MSMVTIERDQGIAWMRIHDGAGNAFGRALAEEVRKATLKLQDSPPKVIVVQGAEDFSTGLASTDDPLFTPFAGLIQNRDAFRAQEIVQRYRNAMEGLSRLSCPIISAIEGICAGPLMALALSADIRIAGRDSTFHPTPLSRGVLPGMGEISMLSHRTHPSRISHVLLTGGHWKAEEALSLGLVSQVVETGQAVIEAERQAKLILETPDATRLQALVTLRAITSHATPADEAECQGGARSWIRGEWQD